MRNLSVDVYADTSRPEGGHAVIRLNGLEKLPDSLTFRLKPVDSAQQGEGTWFGEERLPLVTRLTAAGAELVIGPDIVENPVFLPGTLTAIEIPACSVRGEFLWPRIPPLMRPKRRHLLGAKPARETKIETPEPILFGEAHDASSEVVPVTNGSRAAIAVNGTGSQHSTAATPTIALVPGSAQIQAPAHGDAAVPKAAHGLNGAAPLADVPLVNGTATESTVVAATTPEPDVVWSKAARVATPKGHLLAAALAAFALLAGAFYLGMRVPSSTPNGTRDGDLVALLSIGTTSPRGTRTRDRTPAELIEAADALLHASPANRDKAEAAFMLRRYLAATLSEERTLLALTQLGSIYAEPDGTRAADYGRARQLWEIAATLGDPVAMCFLASLYEHGLGLATSKSGALQWYLRAKDAGGCPKLDDAIARVRK
ncbi:MAG: tetratricopeptide repeat protein [Hyphomicrobiaceae bacterium]